MSEYRWLIYALLSAGAAAFVGIFGKLGMKQIDSTFATAIRGIVMAMFLIAVVSAMGLWHKAKDLQPWPITCVILSGVAGAVSWLFYFKAIQIGTVARVAPIDKLSMPFAVVLAVVLLNERYAWFNWIGLALIVTGAYMAAYTPGK